MKLDFEHLLPTNFSATARVWIYQSSRIFSLSEALQVEAAIEAFIEGWQSHGTPVKGFGTLFYGQFLVLMADEEATGVSGCSTDSSVRMIKSLEIEHQVSLFDRTTLAFVIKDKVQLIPMNQLSYALENGFVQAETLFFDNTVLTKKDLVNGWIKPIKDSWIAKRFTIS